MHRALWLAAGLALAAAFVVPAFADAWLVNFVRVSPADWECQDAAGTTLSKHTRFDTAESACAKRFFAEQDKKFFVVGGKYEARLETL